MPVRISVRFAEVAFCGALASVIFLSWRADLRDRAQLAATLASAKQSLGQADARQHARDAQLQQVLAALATQEHRAVTRAQILHDLPNRLPLPEPLSQLPSPKPDAPANGSSPRPSPSSAETSVARGSPPAVVLPGPDLKPLYDFALDCQACQAKLAADQADLADEKAKSATLTKERDEAVRVAKGGSALARVARAAKWFLIGAAAGAIASHGRL